VRERGGGERGGRKRESARARERKIDRDRTLSEMCKPSEGSLSTEYSLSNRWQ